MNDAYTPTLALVDTLEGLSHSLRLIRDAEYKSTNSTVFSSSIGAHVRHSLDHIQILLAAILSNPSAASQQNPPIVYYDRRLRDTQIEHDRELAIDAIGKLVKKLKNIPPKRLSEKICIEHMMDGNGDTYIFESNIARELFFTAHHAIHHNAIIRARLKELGYKTPENFGVAPSTIEYERHS